MGRDILFRFGRTWRTEIARRLGVFALAAALFGLAPTSVAAGDVGPYSGEPLPRFASLKADLVYMRVGPGRAYAIKWELTRRYMPVRIIGEYDTWRRVELHDGERGWIHRAMLTSRAFAAAHPEEAILREDPKPTARPVARAEAGAPLRLRTCQNAWCQVEAAGHRGWIEQDRLWGADPLR